MTDPVLYEERDDIAIITINRPEKKNTLTDAVIQGIADGIDAAAKSADVAAVVLRGAGDTLTAGYDLTAGSPAGGDEPGWSTPYGARGPEPRVGAWDPVRDYQFMGDNVRRFMKIWECPKPVLGEIKGWAIGGATDLILCADLLYMADDAHIGYAPSRIFGTPTTMLWVYRLGLEHAKQFLLTGRAIDAETAYPHRVGQSRLRAGRPGRLRGGGGQSLPPHPGEPVGSEQTADQPGLREHGPAHLPDAGHLLRRSDPPHRGGLQVGRVVRRQGLP